MKHSKFGSEAVLVIKGFFKKVFLHRIQRTTQKVVEQGYFSTFPTLFHSPLSALKYAAVQDLNWNTLIKPIL